MSKNNWLRASINRNAVNNKNVRIIYHKNFLFFDSWYFRGYNRVYKTWKHNRKQQFKQFKNGNNKF